MTKIFCAALMMLGFAGLPMLTGCDGDKTTTEKTSTTTHGDGSVSSEKSKTTTDSNGNQKTTTEKHTTP